MMNLLFPNQSSNRRPRAGNDVHVAKSYQSATLFLEKNQRSKTTLVLEPSTFSKFFSKNTDVKKSTFGRELLNNRFVKDLTLKKLNIHETAAAELSYGLRNSGIIIVTLQEVRLTNSAAVVLANALTGKQELERLIISNNQDGKGLKNLITQFGGVQILNFRLEGGSVSHRMAANGIRPLLCHEKTRLSTLIFTKLFFEKSVFQMLVKAIGYCQTLKTCQFRECNIDEAASVGLIKVMSELKHSVAQLALRNIPVSKIALYFLSKNLTLGAEWEKILFTNPESSEPVFKAICAGLARNSSLKVIALWNMTIDESVANHFAMALLQSKRLFRILLSTNTFHNSTGEAVHASSLVNLQAVLSKKPLVALHFRF